MELYFRFVFTLACGLTGLGMVLKVLLERVFNDWDFFADVAHVLRETFSSRNLRHSQRAEDFLLEIEKSRQSTIGTRLIDLRRQQLKEIDAVESRLKTTV